jgi:hypothetical protein
MNSQKKPLAMEFANGFRLPMLGTLPGVAQAALQLLALHGPIQPSGLCRNPSFALLASIRSTRLQPERKVHAGSKLAEQRDINRRMQSQWLGCRVRLPSNLWFVSQKSLEFSR